MFEVSTIGLDLAKHVFQVYGIDAAGRVTVDRQLRRSQVVPFLSRLPRCIVGMEACASAHHWAREIARLGHDVRLMPPIRVKPYVKRGGKNDRADAAACCEAVTRPSMQFVAIKSVEQQSALMLHRVRQLLVEQRTRLSNAFRAHLGEFGIVAAKGNAGFSALATLLESGDERVPPAVRPPLLALLAQLRAADAQVDALDDEIIAWHKANADSRRLATVPQIGPIVASAFVATVGDATRFENGRQCAAWLGLVPSQHSTGGKHRLGPITKAGDRYLRQLLVVAASGMIRRARRDPAVSPWFAELLGRKPAKLAAIALANKMARIAWAILAKGGTYRAPASAAA
jgi:transposase